MTKILSFVFFFIFSGMMVTHAQILDKSKELKDFSERQKSDFFLQKSEAVRLLTEKNLPLKSTGEDEYLYEIFRFNNGLPQYFLTHNAGGADLIRSSDLYSGGVAGLNLSGQGVTLGIWDQARVRADHQELTGRVTQIDGATNLSSHATHVAGTMMASGISTTAKGMSFGATLHAHDWNFDNDEMATAGLTSLKVSQHSYGFVTGWINGNFSGQQGWHWFGDPLVDPEEDVYFGYYNEYSAEWDSISYLAPEYLIVKSAGNDRGQGPDPGTSHFFYDVSTGSWQSSTVTRERDGGSDGYDCISHRGLGKNILTVGAVNSSRNMAGFSGWGPTDDGRVKPDVVAKGVGVFSPTSAGISTYGTLNGTSMSGPMVSGSVGLLLEHQENLFPGQSLLSSTLKALIIHTADDMISGQPGPDYRFGWGLMNTRKAAETLTERSDQEAIILENEMFQGDTVSLTLQVENADSLRATLVWTDVPGIPGPLVLNGGSLMLVNDLDMRIFNDSQTFLPYTLNPSQPSLSATTGDNFRDNVEVINISNPDSGTYSLRITHKGQIQNTSQQYSLIISGASVMDCPLLALAPSEVDIINSTCQADCSLSGGSISAPQSSPCPAGSSRQYRVNNGSWTFSIPVYDQYGPPQYIKTRCVCDDMPAIVSSSSEGVSTLPGSCLIVTDSGNTGPGTLRHCLRCAVNGDQITYDDSGVSQTWLTDPLLVDKSVSVSGNLNTGLPIIQLDYNTITGPGIFISGDEVLFENIDIRAVNNTFDEILIMVNTGSILTTKGSVNTED